MSKLFEAEYGDGLARQVNDYIRLKTIAEDGTCKEFRPYAVVTLFDQLGNEII